MTSGSQFPQAAPDASARPSASDRDELLKRERQRRIALIAQRNSGGKSTVTDSALKAGPQQPAVSGGAAFTSNSTRADQDQTAFSSPQLPAGFESQRQWQEALEAARAVSDSARAAGSPPEELDVLMEHMAADELASAVVSAVVSLPPIEAVALLLQGHSARLAVLSPIQAVRGRALIDGLPNQVSGSYELEAPPVVPAAEMAWRLYGLYERIQYTRIEVEHQRQLLSYLPMPVVDNLIDAKRVTAKAVPRVGERRLYLQARLAPAEVDREGLVALGWQEELTRREFPARLARGDVKVLDETIGLTDEQRDLAAELEAVRRAGRVSPELAAQKWLWPALERLAPSAPVNVRKDKAYAPWLLVRRIRRAIQRAHEAQLHGDQQRYVTMLRTARNNAAPLQESWTLAGWEARNALAYILALHSEGDPSYDGALEVLNPALGQALQEDKLPQKAQRHVAANREILRALMEQRNSANVLNPYLVLGVPDGSPTWKDQWRALRCSLDEDGEAQVNEAKDAIQAWERGRAPIALFTLPLMPSRWADPKAHDLDMGRGAVPMYRQTGPATAEQREFARMGAAQGIVQTACYKVGLPVETTTTPNLLSESSHK